MKNNSIQNIPSYDGIGVYALINNSNGKMYIGSSINVNKRIIQHNNSFKNRKCSIAFIPDLNKGDTFSCKILEKLPYGINQFDLYARESHYIERHNTLKVGYNSAKTTCCTKPELLKSLNTFSPNSEMYSYIQNIIRKREQPILAPPNNYDRINVTFPKGQREILKDHAAQRNESVNAFIVRAVNETMERDRS